MLILLLVSGCNNSQKPNIVIITFDTTRADHIGAYGKDNAMTFNVDELSKDGILYKNALSPIPITLPSHSSIMTGKVPFTHGVRDNGLFTLSQENLTLAEILKENGYKTAAAIGSFPLTSQFGINQGFNFFNDKIVQNNNNAFIPNKIKEKDIYFDERNASQVNDSIMPWIEENHQSPFFAWIHYYDPHHPLKPPHPYSQSFIDDLYQGEIAYSDENFGEIISQLKRLKVYNNTLIVFTSDHGEGNGEHDEVSHVFLIYNSTLHVPLIIKFPNQKFANQSIDQWVGLVDIFPTILNELKIPIKSDIQGLILPKNNNFPDSEREIYAESLSGKINKGWGEQRAIIKNKMKYIYGPQKELYNLKLDPNELDNLVESDYQAANLLKSDLQEYIDEHQTGPSKITRNIDEKTLSILRGLGYIQSNSAGVSVIEEKLNNEGDPPQLHVKETDLYNTAKGLMLDGDFINANRVLNSLLELDKTNLSVLESKIYSELNLNNYDIAEQMLRELPKDTYGMISKSQRLIILAKINFYKGKNEIAKNNLNTAESIQMSIEGQYLLSQIELLDNNIKEYEQHLNNILEIDSSLVNILNELAVNNYKTDQIILAEKNIKRSIKLNPYNSNTFYIYARILINQNKKLLAIKYLERSVWINPKNQEFRQDLIESYIDSQQYELANQNLLILKKQNPQSLFYKNNVNIIEANKNEK